MNGPYQNMSSRCTLSPVGKIQIFFIFTTSLWACLAENSLLNWWNWKNFYSFFSAKDEFADGDVPSPKLKRQAFTLEFKLQVMEAAKNSSNREQARLHNIHESVIRRWRKQISEEQIKEAVKDPNKMTLRLKPFTIIVW